MSERTPIVLDWATAQAILAHLDAGQLAEAGRLMRGALLDAASKQGVAERSPLAQSLAARLPSLGATHAGEVAAMYGCSLETARAAMDELRASGEAETVGAWLQRIKREPAP